MLSRRLFLGASASILGAPAIVRASSLMPVYTRPLFIFGDGFHDDAPGLEAYLAGRPVFYFDTLDRVGSVVAGSIHIGRTVSVPLGAILRGDGKTVIRPLTSQTFEGSYLLKFAGAGESYFSNSP